MYQGHEGHDFEAMVRAGIAYGHGGGIGYFQSPGMSPNSGMSPGMSPSGGSPGMSENEGEGGCEDGNCEEVEFFDERLMADIGTMTNMLVRQDAEMATFFDMANASQKEVHKNHRQHQNRTIGGS